MRAGQANISATYIAITGSTQIICRFPMAGAEAGVWDVVVTTPDGQEGVLARGFRIVAIGPTITIVTRATTFVPTTTATPTAVPIYSQYPSSGSNDDSPPAIILPMTVTVNIGGNSAAGKATVTGTKLAELIVTGTVQSGTGSNLTAPSGIVYQYISIVPVRYSSITKAVINFTVPQSWLDEHKIAPESIVLYSQTVNCWEALHISVLYSKEGIVFFSSESTSFSLFAIAGTPAATVPVTTGTTQVIVSSPVQQQIPVQAVVIQTPVITQTTAAPAPATSTKPSSPSSLMNVVLVIAAIGVLAGGGFVARRWWIQRQNPALFQKYD
jgi:PGF-pre-PGF domain-containing protein